MHETMLATRCPHCQTRFRVTTQQLLLRDGLVRCGACREIFNANSSEPTLSPTPHIEPAVALHPTAAPTPIDTAAPDAADSGRMTLMDFGAWPGSTPAQGAPNMQDELDALSKAIADLQKKPWREPDAAAAAPVDQAEDKDEATQDWDNSEPGFVQEARRKQRRARLWKILLWSGLPILLLLLLGQLTYRFRDEIAARVPESDPYLRQACAHLGCIIALPAHINALSLQSSQLVAVTGQTDQFELVALVRNSSPTPQAWPALELQLKDQSGALLVRKVFLPGEFISQVQERKIGIAARSEREIRILFTLADAPAADFQLTLFYQ